jgi:hypothetical protein
MQHLLENKPRRWQYLTFDEQQRIRKGLPLYPIKKENKPIKKKKVLKEKLFNAEEWIKRLENLKTQ